MRLTKNRLRLAAFALLCSFWSGATFAFDVNIMTGSETGTYIQIGRDIAALASNADFHVEAVPSAGSLENIDAVRNRAFTQFGIVQSDVLDFITTFHSKDPAMRSLVRTTRSVFPLYNEAIQVVVRKSSGITTLAGLSGRVVAVGAPDSGTNLTSTFLLEIANVRPSQLVTINPAQALPELLADRIDAFIYVAGAPTKILADQPANADLALVPSTGTALGEYYGLATIPAGTYPWLATDVTTPAVRAVLMTYEYNPARNAYHRASCEAVKRVTNVIRANIERFRQAGHPKWKQVDLNADVPGWKHSQCVEAALREPIAIAGPSDSETLPEDCSTITNPISLQICNMRNARK